MNWSSNDVLYIGDGNELNQSLLESMEAIGSVTAKEDFSNGFENVDLDSFDAIVSEVSHEEVLQDIREESDVPYILFGSSNDIDGNDNYNVNYVMKRGHPMNSIRELSSVIEEETQEWHEKLDDEWFLELMNKSLIATDIEVYCIDSSGDFIFANRKMCDKLGYSEHELDEMKIWDIDPNISEEDRKQLKREIEEKEKIVMETEHVTKDGERYPVEILAHSLDVNGDNVEFVTARDISTRVEKDRKINYLNNHDKLTGLPNRKYFENELEQFNELDIPLSIIKGDINGLEDINNELGYGIGDELISETANILRQSTEDCDIVSRYAGDEFAILMPETDYQVAEKIYEEIKEKINDLKEEYDTELSIGLGIGSRYNSEDDVYDILEEASVNLTKDKLVDYNSTRNNVIESFMKALEAKSHETAEHALRMEKMSRDLGRKIGLTKSELNDLSLVSQLHDIGKIAVPEYILKKDGSLTDEDWKIIKKHPEEGSQIVAGTDDFEHLEDPILHHHEWWNGGGYPDGIETENIPLGSRIISIVDAYDVMTNGRVYKDSISKASAKVEIQKNSGKQFDPYLVDKFLELDYI